MKVVFNEKFFDSEYIHDSASVPGRMEAIIDAVKSESNYQLCRNETAEYEDINRVHSKEYIAEIQKKNSLFQMALLSAGGAIKASQIAMSSEPAFACIRPPGHHASRSSGWGYCYFCNMAIALRKLKDEGRISSAFILDFDAHTGDGTRDCLSDWKDARILNPMAEDNTKYISLIKEFIQDIDYVDIIAVNAGFDSYKMDIGHKLETTDFNKIGVLLRSLSEKIGHNRRFAILEGGYYLPDLGKNVVSFCEGFKK
jgi:acetoin utilization deacetylase AcuC-like enzyme